MSGKLREGGLLEQTGRGLYRCSELGATGFLMVSLALRRLMNALETFDEYFEEVTTLASRVRHRRLYPGLCDA